MVHTTLDILVNNYYDCTRKKRESLVPQITCAQPFLIKKICVGKSAEFMTSIVVLPTQFAVNAYTIRGKRQYC